MNEFFTFILDETILKEIIRPEWIKLYDYKYIDKTVIEGLLKWFVRVERVDVVIIGLVEVDNLDGIWLLCKFLDLGT